MSFYKYFQILSLLYAGISLLTIFFTLISQPPQIIRAIINVGSLAIFLYFGLANSQEGTKK